MSHVDNMNQGRYWILTIPANDFNKDAFTTSFNSNEYASIQYLTGQLEQPSVHEEVCATRNNPPGGLGTPSCTCTPTPGFRHWQLVVGLKRKLRLGGVKQIFGERCHAELTRSDAAIAYVHKDDTAIDGTRFTLGRMAVSRARTLDWEAIRESCKRGRLDDLPADSKKS